MNRKIDFNSLVLNPIRDFSDFIIGHLDESIDDYLTTKWKLLGSDRTQACELTKKINAAVAAINRDKKEQKIKTRIFCNGLIMLSFVFVIGLVLLPIYLKNKRIITNFDAQASKHNQAIQQLMKDRFNTISSLFSVVTFTEAISFVMNDFGISSNYDWSMVDLDQFILKRFPNLVDYNGFSGMIRNTLVYDLVVREHNIRDVTTSMTMAFPYEDYFIDENGDEVPIIREEILVAYHTEPTPFLDESNIVVYPTNFVPELCFTTFNPKGDRHLLLENKEFMRDYKIIDSSNNSQKLAEFFTIKSQEDFVNWFNHEHGEVFSFSKHPYQLVVHNHSNKNLSYFWTNEPITILRILADKTAELTSYIDHFKSLIRAYFIRWTKMVQIPLLVPGICREWYQANGSYLIANFSNQNQTTSRLVSVNEIISRFANNSLIFYSKDYPDLKRKRWLSHTQSDPTPNCCVHRFNLNSYWSEILIDEVSVIGINVGMQLIPVSYEKFHQIQEPKIIFVGLPTHLKDTLIISGADLREMIVGDYYQDQDLTKNFILKNNVWTSNPGNLEQNLTGQLRNFLDKLNEINNQYQLQLLIQLDQSGSYVIANDLSNYSMEVEQAIVSCFPSSWLRTQS